MNNQNKEINETIKRTQRYWYVDGFAEIGIGLLLIVIILFNYFVDMVQQSTLQIVLFVVGLPALILLGSRGISRMVVMLKEKYTYPRTGYVSYQKKTGSRKWQRIILTGLMGALVGAITSILSSHIAAIYQYLFVSVVIALCYLYIGSLLRLGRFYGIAIATLILSGILIAMQLQEMQFFLAFFVGQGVTWIISGLTALIHYFRSTQPPLEGEA